MTPHHRIRGLSGWSALVVGFVLAVAGGAQAQQGASGSTPAATRPGSDSRGAWRGACSTDIVRLCRTVKGGQGKRQCLEANLTKVAAGCQAALTERRQQREEALRVCRADLQTLCKDVARGRGAKLQCLREKSASASPDCAKALAGLPAGGGSKSAAPKN